MVHEYQEEPLHSPLKIDTDRDLFELGECKFYELEPEVGMTEEFGQSIQKMVVKLQEDNRTEQLETLNTEIKEKKLGSQVY